jgi:hypothetical protein
MASDNQQDASNWQVENLKGAIALATVAIQTLTLVNGGAVISILTFYGNVVAKQPSVILIDRTNLKVALVLFGLGVFAATAAACCAYTSQLASAIERYPKSESAVRTLGIASGVFSALFFLIGVVFAAVSLI